MFFPFRDDAFHIVVVVTSLFYPSDYTVNYENTCLYFVNKTYR